MNEQLKDSQLDRALGAMYGALIGDAAGSTLEFLGRNPSEAEVEEAMQLVGRGVFELAPGQVTDDGELTLCLARALSAQTRFDLGPIAQNYAEWVSSGPFDIGGTTMDSLGAGVNLFLAGKPASTIAETIRQSALNNCMESKANGSMMRAVPLGIWSYQHSIQQQALVAKADSGLSHPNESCTDSVACYVIAIASLIRSGGDREQAWNDSSQWANENACQEVLDWLDLARNFVDVPFHPHIGFVKIAFCHAFRHLLAGSSYSEAIRETLLGGGDTDTNACIVGGLIGAAEGTRRLPSDLIEVLLNCNFEQGQQPRPASMNPRQAEKLTRLLLEVANNCR